MTTQTNKQNPNNHPNYFRMGLPLWKLRELEKEAKAAWEEAEDFDLGELTVSHELPVDVRTIDGQALVRVEHPSGKSSFTSVKADSLRPWLEILERSEGELYEKIYELVFWHGKTLPKKKPRRPARGRRVAPELSKFERLRRDYERDLKEQSDYRDRMRRDLGLPPYTRVGSKSRAYRGDPSAESESARS